MKKYILSCIIDKNSTLNGGIYMSATEAIKKILKDKNISQVELAEKIKVTKQNLSNKLNRDNFSTLELVEIADALNMKLLLKNVSDQTEYLIDYPSEHKGKPKRTKKEPD